MPIKPGKEVFKAFVSIKTGPGGFKHEILYFWTVGPDSTNESTLPVGAREELSLMRYATGNAWRKVSEPR